MLTNVYGGFLTTVFFLYHAPKQAVKNHLKHSEKSLEIPLATNASLLCNQHKPTKLIIPKRFHWGLYADAISAVF